MKSGDILGANNAETMPSVRDCQSGIANRMHIRKVVKVIRKSIKMSLVPHMRTPAAIGHGI